MPQTKQAISPSRYRRGKRLVMTLLLACLLATGSYVWKWWGPTPYAVAWKFAQAWKHGDIDGLYALLDDVPDAVIGTEERRRPPREGFEWLMHNYMFRICPPGTRWRFEVSDPDYMVFRFTTSQRHWMAVPVRRSLDGRWRVTGMQAMRTLYADYRYNHIWPTTTNDPVQRQFHSLWASAWTKPASLGQF